MNDDQPSLFGFIGTATFNFDEPMRELEPGEVRVTDVTEYHEGPSCGACAERTHVTLTTPNGVVQPCCGDPACIAKLVATQ